MYPIWNTGKPRNFNDKTEPNDIILNPKVSRELVSSSPAVQGTHPAGAAGPPPESPGGPSPVR